MHVNPEPRVLRLQHHRPTCAHSRAAPRTRHARAVRDHRRHSRAPARGTRACCEDCEACRSDRSRRSPAQEASRDNARRRKLPRSRQQQIDFPLGQVRSQAMTTNSRGLVSRRRQQHRPRHRARPAADSTRHTVGDEGSPALPREPARVIERDRAHDRRGSSPSA